MRKYGEVALWAAKLLRAGHNNAEDAWREVAEQMFDDAPSAKAKTCPREAFLGLCQAGLLEGVPRSRCGKMSSGRNRLYAKAAVDVLRANPELTVERSTELWKRVMVSLHEPPSKTHNGQMDVVLALWENRFLSGQQQ